MVITIDSDMQSIILLIITCLGIVVEKHSHWVHYNLLMKYREVKYKGVKHTLGPLTMVKIQVTGQKKFCKQSKVKILP